MEVTSRNQWLDTLSAALDKARSMKMPKKIIAKSAAQLGEFLFESIDPDIPENRLLKQMWEVADDREKEVIANVMIKLVEERKRH